MKLLLIVAFVHAVVGAAVLEKRACGMFCTAQYDPVCGSDGITYSNTCFLGIASCRDSTITLAHRGPCGHHHQARADCQMACFAVYDPVCGSDGKTYSNSCMLKSSNCMTSTPVTVAHHGACSGDLVVS